MSFCAANPDTKRRPTTSSCRSVAVSSPSACRAVGIRYEHLPELGIACARRKNLATQADRDALFSEYARDTLPNEAEALDRISAWIQSGSRVALTCFEARAGECHRSTLAAALRARLSSAHDVAHL